MTDYKKPLPISTVEQEPFWEYCRKHELRMQKCPDCGYIRFPSSIICPNCHSMAEAEWVRLSGKGKVFSFVTFRYAYNKTFAEDIPYAIASVELEEGPRMMSDIVGCSIEDIKVGMPLEVYFDDVTDGVTLPKFKPAP